MSMTNNVKYLTNPRAVQTSVVKKSAALVVGETQAFPARLELFFQNAVLFDQIGDHGRLLTTDPAGKRGQQKLELDVFKHSRSVSDRRQVVLLQHDRIFGHYELRIWLPGLVSGSALVWDRVCLGWNRGAKGRATVHLASAA